MKDSFWNKVKTFISEIKGWGLSAILAFILGLYLLFSGYKLFAGIAFGIFLTRNWDIVAALFDKYVAPKIDF